MEMEEKNDWRYEFECLKIIAVVEDALRSFTLLSGISEAEDNSSELAGFEINKLLKEQSKLEKHYTELLSKRRKLKGIENKQKHNQTQTEIKDIARALKESTKKLCRLFKENKHLSEDSEKVRKERGDAEKDLAMVIDLIRNKKFYQFQDIIFDELMGHYKLEDFQSKEKELLSDVKRLQMELAECQQEYQREISEKTGNIKMLRESLLKARAESEVSINYKIRQLEAEEQTERRLQEQVRNDIMNEKQSLEQMRQTEDIGFAKMREVFEIEKETLQKDLVKWTERRDNKVKELEDEVTLAQNKLTSDQERLQRLLALQEQEKNALAEEDRKLKAMLQERQKQIENEGLTDKAMKQVQYHFEQWYQKVGQFIKKKKKKAKTPTK